MRACDRLVAGPFRSNDDGDTWVLNGLAPDSITAGAGCMLYGKVSSSNVYISKCSPDGRELQWGAYLAGSNAQSDAATIAVDSAGNVVVAGSSSAGGGPFGDVWVASIDPSGKPNYSTSFGSGHDTVSALSLDRPGNAYVAGRTLSPDFPVTADAAQHAFGGGGSDAFLAIVSNTGVTYATFAGGESYDVATAVGVDSQGRVTLGGSSAPPTFSRQTAFLVSLQRPGGQWQTIRNVAGTGTVDAIAIGSDDSIYVTGVTGSPDFESTRPPFANGFNAAPQDANGLSRYLLRLRADSLNPIYSAVLGTGTNFPFAGSSFGSAKLQIRPSGNAILQVSAADSFPHRAPLYIGGGAFWTEVSPYGMNLGYSGVLTNISGNGLQLLALANDGTLLASDVSGLYRVTMPRIPEISLDHVANAFSGVGRGVAPGAVYSLTGHGLGPAVPVWLPLDAADPPITLGGVRVLFNDDVPARLLYVSAHRIICIAPDTHTNTSQVQVEFGGKRSNSVFAIMQADPGLLTASFPEAGPVAYAENPDGSANGPENPVTAGSPIVFYATGYEPGASALCGTEPSSAKPVRGSLDKRFSGNVYRIECTAPATAGPASMRLIQSFMVHGNPEYSDISNSVAIYVK